MILTWIKLLNQYWRKSNGKEQNEYDGKEYTGYVIKAKVTYVLRNCPEYGLMDGYCVFGIKPYYKGYYFRGKRRNMNVIENY